ncbi:MAG TPA: FlgD immunoglobulin-like domain containing protein [Candidatus Eisenbacteria bacterium]|nr:FlgD immunoglobulin-like domain containing protein [Candidatus Eisenbacteria bacterium]
MVASYQMNSRRLRRRRSWAQLAAVGSLLVAAPPAAHAIPETVALRGVPSSLAASFGPAVTVGAGVIAVPTGSGADLYDLSQPSTPLLGRFRTAGNVARASVAGSTLFLFAGPRGVVAVDVSNPANPVAAGSAGDLGTVTLGAAASSGGGVVAGGGSTLHFLSWDAASGFTLRRTLVYSDGRTVGAVAARGDSFLVASVRGTLPTRLILTLYRMRAGAAAPDSLEEFAFNGHRADDLAWVGAVAFVADGNLGVLAIDVAAHALRSVTPVQGTQFVRSVDANDSVVVAATEGKTLARFARVGAAGDTLTGEIDRVLTGNPAYARLSGDWIVASTYDQIAPAPPDEPGRSLLELVSLSGAPDRAPVGATGRVRRVAVKNGLAYVANYSGGLRIYRAGGGDSSLVGVAPPSGNARPVDVAVDPALPLVYLASGPAGLEVVQVGDPAAPIPVATLTLAGSASAVTQVGPNLVAVATRGLNPAVTFVRVDYQPLDSTVTLNARGSVGNPFVQDPRGLAARDTVLFVADESLGLLSIGFGNPDQPAAFGTTSLAGARDVDLSGTLLLVATRTRGLQIVDVANPAQPVLRAELATPPLLGVARNGTSAVVFAGDLGALVVDVGVPSAPVTRGPILPPGVARDGWWTGDTLLVAASLGLERYLVSPAPTVVPVLDVRLDPASATPRALVTWTPVVRAGMVGLNLYRDLVTASGTASDPAGRRVNRDLLPPGAVSAVDDSLIAGGALRYRLEAFFADGSSVKVAEGTLSVASAPLVGRAYPNPFRARPGAVASLSYRVPNGSAGAPLTLRVFDVSGRVVRESRAPAQPVSGFGIMTWDGRDRNGGAAPSGVYYLRLTGAGLDDSRAIILLR